MDTKTKKQWVAALRSGEYKQGNGKLRALAPDSEGERTGEEQFCCLGVICDIIEPNQWKKEDSGEWANGRGGSSAWTDDTSNTDMPRAALQKKLGLDKPVTRTGGDGNTIADKLAQMNDDGHTFSEIADWIEKRTI